MKTARDKKLPLIVLMEAPSHGNIGDAAISGGGNCFLRDFFRDNPIIEVNDCERDNFLAFFPAKVKPTDTLIIHGGGFLGTLWFSHEEAIRKIMTLFPDNRVIIFPQTIYFEDSRWGKQELDTTQQIWQAHKYLSVCLREKNSFDFVKNNLVGGEFRNVHLIPDIVLYMDKQRECRRDGVLFVFRSDKEKVQSGSVIERLTQIMAKHSLEVKSTDTVIKHRRALTAKTRPVEVEKKLQEFRQSKLVITDRLHGMIFAAITGTPCVALNNLSGKVGGVYEWIKYLPYVKFAQDADEAVKFAEELLAEDKVYKYDNTPLMPHFEQLAKVVRGEL
jgi:pyruvyl transferase EpsI